MMTDEEAYKEYLIQKWHELYLMEEDYNLATSDHKMMLIWQGYRQLKEIPPEPILEHMDRFIETQEKNERSRRKKSGHQMGFRDYLIIKNAESPANQLREYADREGILLDTARKRLRVQKQHWESIFNDLKTRGEEKT